MKKIYDLNDLSDNQIGCWIDGANMSGQEFDIQLVETALHFGLTLNVEDWKELKNQLEDYPGDESILEDLMFVAEWAYDWFNIKAEGTGYYFEIDANCLFLTHEDLELIND
jgi:extradiol dioxygenase family protein